MSRDGIWAWAAALKAEWMLNRKSGGASFFLGAASMLADELPSYAECLKVNCEVDRIAVKHGLALPSEP